MNVVNCDIKLSEIFFTILCARVFVGPGCSSRLRVSVSVCVYMYVLSVPFGVCVSSLKKNRVMSL